MAAVLEFVANDRTLVLGQEQYVRRMGSFGNNWNRLLILLRAAPYATGSFTWNVTIAVTAPGRGYNAVNSDCVGVYWNQAVSVSGPPYTFVWTWGGGNAVVFTRFNGVNTEIAVGNTGGRNGSVMPVMNVWGADIQRVGNTFTVAHVDHGVPFALGQASLTSSMARGNIHYDAHQPSVTGIRNCFSVETAAPGLAYSGAGNLDSVLIRNGSTTAPLCISDIIVYRYY